MFRLALRSVAARWARLLLTGLAVLASTSFLSGTFVFRDTIERTFDALFADVFERVDGYVQSSNSVETFLGFSRRDRLPIDVVEQVRAVPGVADAQASVQDDAVIIGKDGFPIERPTAPTFGATVNSGELSVWRVRDGRLPSGGDEMVVDAITADDEGFIVGDVVRVNSEVGARDFTLVGIVEYDDIISPSNATWAMFDEATASEFIAKPGYVDAVLVLGDGTVPGDVLVERIAEALDPDVAEVLSSAEITAQTQSDVERTLSFVTIFLGIFSFIALGVGVFVIYNVFSITAAQRQRENALLRALGASRRQVTASLLIEALVIGVVGSFAGVLGGYGLAAGVKWLLDALDYVIPARGLVLQPRTIAITMLAGTVASLVAAIGPAVGAGRVPPVAAMNDAALEKVGNARRRVVLGSILALVGVAAIAAVMGGADAMLLGLGVVCLFAAVLVLGPVMAKPIARTIGAPVQRFRGVTGAMARGNVQRNPRRTARTAAPVLIGVALVTGAAVFASSIKEQIRQTLGETFVGDYVVNSTRGGGVNLPAEFVDEVNALPEVGVAAGIGFATLATPDGTSVTGWPIDPAAAEVLLGLEFVEGTVTDLTPDGVLVSANFARSEELTVGSPFAVRIDGTVVELTVQGVYEPGEVAPERLYHRDLLRGSSLQVTSAFVVLTAADGVSDAALREAMAPVLERYPIGELENRDQFIESRSDLVDRSLAFIYGLLFLSIMIATFGIVITLLLAVYERRRETGLLRAVGMTRAQVRTTVRWESVITSVYGATVGVVMGLVLGYVVIVALRDQGLTEYSIPVANIVWIMVLAFVAGVLAAVVPAWRATRMDVLRAIAADG